MARATDKAGKATYIMDLGFTLIDATSGLVSGPYETFDQARDRAEYLLDWEILNHDGDLVDWSRKPAAPAVSLSAQTA